jgi:hypothetical protein
MPRYLAIELGGVTVRAVLREDVAPRTVAALVGALPITARAAHCICSGECVFFTSEQLPLVDPENATAYVSQGDVVLGPRRELVIVYGRRCSMRGFSGYYPSNAFAMVRDLDAMDRFAEIGRKTLMEGAKPITVRLEA